MRSNNPADALRGRGRECGELRQLVDDVRAGGSRVLVLRGDAGIGKTALLDYLCDAATGFRVIRAAGVESDVELAFAGLHQLCVPLLDRADQLPQPQANALKTAFGHNEGATPDRFLVGLAVLGLISAAADDGPLLWVVDDAQWLDQVSAQTMSFVARRLLAEPVGLVFAARGPVFDLSGLPEREITGLTDDDARRLLESAIAGPIDTRVRDRIVAETRGNPLALLELPRDLTVAQLAGGYYRPDALPVAGRLENHYTRRIRALPEDTQRLLAVAAAEPLGEVTLLLRAAALLGIDLNAATPAQSDGLLDIDTRVRFRHPLIRAAAYRSAALDDRRAAHRTLGDVTDPDVDPDRRAWHRAYATAGPDESVAAELQQSAGRAAQRGGSAAAAAFLTRAAELTPDPVRRGLRALAAAEASREAAAPEAVGELLDIAAQAPLDDVSRARADRLRARLMLARGRGGDESALILDAVTRLHSVASRLESLDLPLAVETHFDAITAAMYVGRLGGPNLVGDTVAGAHAAASAQHPPRPVDLVVSALATRLTADNATALPALRAAADALGPESWLWQSFPLAHEVVTHELWDDGEAHRLTEAAVRMATESGALAMLPMALVSRAGVHVLAGEFAAARSLIAEADEIAAATGYEPVRYHRLTLAAWAGDEVEATRIIETALRNGSARGEGRIMALTAYATAVLNNGLGRYQIALDAARTACEYEDLGLFSWSVTELLEAAVRAGEHTVAAEALQRIDERTVPAGTDWALGMRARSQAMLSTDGAEDLYLEAIERLTRTRVAVQSARSHLLYGEWLRRRNRRTQARAQLRIAHELFEKMGARAFAERARRELVATGEKTPKRAARVGDELTPQEQQIAEFAGAGLTNPEIGARLFISAHTVEWHLRKIFTKLGIHSRRELRDRSVG